jgi:serine protease AprX
VELKKKRTAQPSDAKLDRALRSMLAQEQRMRTKGGRSKALLRPPAKVPATHSGRQVRIIVQFHGRLCRFRLASLRSQAGKGAIRKGSALRIIDAYAAKAPLASVRRMCSSKHVRRITLDRRRRIALNVATKAVGASAAGKAGLTGRGVTIAVLDTGIYPHPDLTRPRNRIVAFKDFINGRSRPYDDNGHGTHCAGDAVGNGYSSRGKYRGPATEARLVGVKVLDKEGTGYDSDIIRGIEWCIRNRRKYGIRILSMSLGVSAKEACANDPLCQAVGKAWRKGLVVVTSAGNTGPKRGTVESPGINPLVLTVGAADDKGTTNLSDETVPPYSSRGPAKGGSKKPDLLAPGTAITSLRAPGSTLDLTDKKARKGRWYFTMTGTSMAAPIVAGAAAQLLQKYPRCSPNRVKRTLIKHADSLGLPGNTQGAGMLNMRFLIKRLTSSKRSTRSARSSKRCNRE